MTTDPPGAEWRDGHRRWPAVMAAQRIVDPSLRAVAGLTVLGGANVPRTGPLLVVANHVHNADTVLLWLAMHRALHFMGKQELFAVPVLGSLIRALGGFPVDRGAADRSAIRTAEARLADGYAVAMFPEGTRSPTGRLQPGHPGAGLIALHSRAPILPVGISGTRCFPFSRSGQNSVEARFGRGHAVVNVGIPFILPDEIAKQRGAAAAATALMMAEIDKLLPPDQRADEHVADPSAALGVRAPIG